MPDFSSEGSRHASNLRCCQIIGVVVVGVDIFVRNNLKVVFQMGQWVCEHFLNFGGHVPTCPVQGLCRSVCQGVTARCPC